MSAAGTTTVMLPAPVIPSGRSSWTATTTTRSAMTTEIAIGAAYVSAGALAYLAGWYLGRRSVRRRP